MTEKDLVTLTTLARRTRKSPTTLRQMIEAGQLVPTRIMASGRHEILFDQAAIDAAGLTIVTPASADGAVDEALRGIVQDAVRAETGPLLNRIDELRVQIEHLKAEAERLPTTSLHAWLRHLATRFSERLLVARAARRGRR